MISEGTSIHDVAVVDTLLPAGSGSGRHVHYGHEEAFFVLEGEVEFEVGDASVCLGSGGFAFAPLGQVHAFANRSESSARMLALYTPAAALSYLEELAKIVQPDGSTDNEQLQGFYRRFQSAAG